MIEPHRAAYFARLAKPNGLATPKIREEREIEMSFSRVVKPRDFKIPKETLALVARIKRVTAGILKASSPTKLPPPEATEEWRRPGTYRVNNPTPSRKMWNVT
jgi:hypothetical protein